MTKSKISVKKPRDDRDRLSKLPDSLILIILGLLPMRDVVRTGILSKRWKNLWTTVPYLNFDDCNDCKVYNRDEVRNFVNQALKSWRGNKILKLKIEFCRRLRKPLSSDIGLWVRLAMERGVEELQLHFLYRDTPIRYGSFDSDEFDSDNEVKKVEGVYYDINREEVYWPPPHLYSSSTFKELSFKGCNLRIKGNVQWNQLKSLTMDCYYWLRDNVIEQVLCGCPRLEVFNLTYMEDHKSLSVQSSSLKKLSIKKYYFYDMKSPLTDAELRIWTPNLETFEILGLPYGKCLLMNVSSLTRATLLFYAPRDYERFLFSWNDFLGDILISQIFPTIQHVERVALSDWCIKALGEMKKKDMVASLSSTKSLELYASKVEKIVKLLEISPGMTILVLQHMDLRESDPHGIDQRGHDHIRETSVTSLETEKWVESKTDLPESYLLQLRTVEITWYAHDDKIFPFIEFVLKHASNLEKMVIIWLTRKGQLVEEESFSLAEEKVVSMSRSSHTANVTVCIASSHL